MRTRGLRRGKRNETGKQKQRTQLSVECLEDRFLLNAGGLDALAEELNHPVELAVVPNDPRFGEMYGLNNTGGTGKTADADIDAPEAWDVTTGSLKTVVAIVDTGIDYRHVDLFKNIWINQAEIPSAIKSQLIDTDSDGLITFWDLNDTRNQGTGKIVDKNGNGRIDGGDLLYSTSTGGWANGISDDGDGYVDDLIGWNFLGNNNNPLDDNGHGTHVSGTIGAIGNNGVGVTGINWKVQMMALKFLGNSGSGTLAGAIDALNYAVAHGAQISNHSWTIGDYYSQQLYDAVNAARLKGHIVVASASNGGSDGVGDNNDITPAYPASFALDNVVAVAATGANDTLANFSNYGAKSVDLAAPGVSILSTVLNNGYSLYSGTSMAAPHVVGVLALVHSQHPTWTYAQKIQQVLGTVDHVTALDGKVVTNGRLNAAKAVGYTVPGTSGPRIVSVTPNATGSAPVSSLRVTFDKAIDTTTFTLSDILSFTGPNGNIAAKSVVAVSGSGNKAFNVTFTQQSTPGAYRMTIGSEIKDTAGNRMAQGQYVASFAINPVYTYSAGLTDLRDNATTVSEIIVDRDITIADLNIKTNISHYNVGDLYIYVIGPDGTKTVLFNQRGGTGDHLTATVFNDEATTSIVNGVAPFKGAYRPEQALSAFDGKNARGNWTLYVEDRAAGNTGRMHYWNLIIEGAVAGGQSFDTATAETSEAEAIIESVTASSAAFAPSAAAVSDAFRLGTDRPAESGVENTATPRSKSAEFSIESEPRSAVANPARAVCDAVFSGKHAKSAQDQAQCSLESLMTIFADGL